MMEGHAVPSRIVGGTGSDASVHGHPVRSFGGGGRSSILGTVESVMAVTRRPEGSGESPRRRAPRATAIRPPHP